MIRNEEDGLKLTFFNNRKVYLSEFEIKNGSGSVEELNKAGEKLFQNFDDSIEHFSVTIQNTKKIISKGAVNHQILLLLIDYIRKTSNYSQIEIILVSIIYWLCRVDPSPKFLLSEDFLLFLISLVDSNNENVVFYSIHLLSRIIIASSCIRTKLIEKNILAGLMKVYKESKSIKIIKEILICMWSLFHDIGNIEKEHIYKVLPMFNDIIGLVGNEILSLVLYFGSAVLSIDKEACFLVFENINTVVLVEELVNVSEGDQISILDFIGKLLENAESGVAFTFLSQFSHKSLIHLFSSQNRELIASLLRFLNSLYSFQVLDERIVIDAKKNGVVEFLFSQTKSELYQIMKNSSLALMNLYNSFPLLVFSEFQSNGFFILLSHILTLESPELSILVLKSIESTKNIMNLIGTDEEMSKELLTIETNDPNMIMDHCHEISQILNDVVIKISQCS